MPTKSSLAVIVLVGVFGAFLMGLVNMLFLIPLQFVASKRGKQDFLLSSILTLLVGLLFWSLRGRGIDFLIPLGLLFALFVMNSDQLQQGWLRLIIAAALSAAGTMIMLLITGRGEMLSDMLEILRAIPEMQQLLSDIVPGTGLEQQLNFLLDLLFRSVLLSSTLVLLFAYGIGRGIAQGIRSLFQVFVRFTFPEELIWFFIISLVALMLGEALNIPFFIYGGWNCLLLSALLYWIRGLGILIRFAQSRPFLRVALPGLLILVIILPGVNLIFSIGLAVLGISSIWIPKLERIHERKNNESNS